ncbi:MAG: serine/threonine protein kinase [Sandaracinaceae bacterium]|nr:serine/threonine protein kinase [Sandaracinaceae bacterium]
MAQVASALQYVHHAKGVSGRPLNIVHRDVSPHNVMLSWSGQVKLLDFGIAKTSAEGDKGGSAGKYGYMSPEQAQSMPVDARSDLFALGVVLYEALVGRPLYDRPTLLDTLSAIVREPVPSLRRERPELPEALEHIVHRALAKSPAQRFQSAGELRAALKSVLRAAGQNVLETRVALTLDGLFTAAEKAPLRPESQQLTGSFAALTAEGASAAIEEVTFETFAHDSERPPAAVDTMQVRASAASTKKRGSSVLMWIGMTLLFFVALGAGAALAVALLR